MKFRGLLQYYCLLLPSLIWFQKRFMPSQVSEALWQRFRFTSEKSFSISPQTSQVEELFQLRDTLMAAGSFPDPPIVSTQSLFGFVLLHFEIQPSKNYLAF